MRFKIDWASLIVGMKFTVFALFCFVFEGNFQVQAPPPGGVWGLYSEGRFNGGFFALRVWGAYIWRGLYMEGSYGTVEALVSGHHPGHAKKVSITAAGRLRECKNTPEFVWKLRKTARFVKMAQAKKVELSTYESVR